MRPSHRAIQRTSIPTPSLISTRRTTPYQPSNHDRHTPRYETRRHLTTPEPFTTVQPPPPPPDLFINSAASTTKPITPPLRRAPSTQPPSHRAPEDRRSQLHRQYTSLLQGTPLILLFQHNNLRMVEWSALRRELNNALLKAARQSTNPEDVAHFDAGVKPRILVVRTAVFGAALRVIEHYLPKALASGKTPAHLLSEDAHRATLRPGIFKSDGVTPVKRRTSLEPLLTGPLALVTFPALSPQQLATVLSILAPQAGAFPAPKRREQPGLYEPSVQSALGKLLLLGARVDERPGVVKAKAMDSSGVRFVGSLGARGGLEGLRAEVAGLLQGVGMGLVGGLEGAGRAVWATVEGRRVDMEGGEKKEEGEKKET